MQASVTTNKRIAFCEVPRTSHWSIISKTPTASFYRSNKTFNRTEAELFCTRNGAELATFQNRFEYEALKATRQANGWIGGRRICKDTRKFICDSKSETGNYFVNRNSQRVDKFAQWSYMRPTNSGDRDNSIILKDDGKMEDHPDHHSFFALCRKTWEPQFNSERADFIVSTAKMTHEKAEIFCHTLGFEMASFRTANDRLNQNVKEAAWVQGKRVNSNSYDPFLLSDGSNIVISGSLEFVQNNNKGERVYLAGDKLYNDYGDTKKLALCEKQSEKNIVIFGDQNEKVKFLRSRTSKFTYSEAQQFCLSQNSVALSEIVNSEDLQLTDEELLFLRNHFDANQEMIKFDDYIKLVEKRDYHNTFVLCRKIVYVPTAEDMKNPFEMFKTKMNCQKWVNEEQQLRICEIISDMTFDMFSKNVHLQLLLQLGQPKYDVIFDTALAETIKRECFINHEEITESGA